LKSIHQDLRSKVHWIGWQNWYPVLKKTSQCKANWSLNPMLSRKVQRGGCSLCQKRSLQRSSWYVYHSQLI